MAAPPPLSPHAVRTWRAAWQGRVRVALNDANRAVKDWEVRDEKREGIGPPPPASAGKETDLPPHPLTHTHPHTQTAVREGGLAAAGVGNAAMQEE